MKISIVAFGILLLGAVPLSALADEEQEEAKAETEERVCFDVRRVSSFDGLTDEHVFISIRRNENYLLTMRNRCIGLRDAYGIVVRDMMNRVCSGRTGSEIAFRGPMNRVERCQIDTVVPVENKDEARAIVAEQEEYKRQQREQRQQDGS